MGKRGVQAAPALETERDVLKRQLSDALLALAGFFRGSLFNRTNGKEFVAARLTAKGGEPEQTADCAHEAGNVFRRDALEVEIAADGAVSVAPVVLGHGAGAKTMFAFVTAPWHEASNAINVVVDPATPRAAASRRMT
ncbi:MAG TPA: hypothetical protein VKT53_02690 [Candidatus Acidoferrum sp.]|nr:hypothetical protein [Candidatus Acidoferrum sp.]